MGYAAGPQVVSLQLRRVNISFDAALFVPQTGSGRCQPTTAGKYRYRGVGTPDERCGLTSIPLASPSQNPLAYGAFDNAGSKTVILPNGPPPGRSSAGEYRFRAPQHSYKGSQRAFSPPPPSYRSSLSCLAMRSFFRSTAPLRGHVGCFPISDF